MSETRPTSKLREHADATLVPAMSAEEYRALLGDVRECGLQVPLEITSAGIVLDGRHRLLVARELDLQTVPVRVVSPMDELVHMLSAALLRRHLSQSQKAALALELDEYRQARTHAEKRQRANLRGSSEVATLPPRGEKTREIPARRAGVSPRTVQDAIAVRAADPALFARVKAGELPQRIGRGASSSGRDVTPHSRRRRRFQNGPTS
jgi:ParB-like chromosome segregation protein Spo0J